MSLQYERRALTSTTTLQRRILIVFSLSIFAGLLWHIFRPSAIELAARSSSGARYRSAVSRELIKARYPEKCREEYGIRPRSIRLGKRTYTSWTSGENWHVVNDDFDYLGGFRGRPSWIALPADLDDDGHVEVVRRWYPKDNAGVVRDVMVNYVVRLGEKENRIVGAFGLTVVAPTGRSYPTIRFIQRDNTWCPNISWRTHTKVAGWREIITTHEYIASFDWTAPGGILQLSGLALNANPEEVFCLSPDELPVSVPVDADLDSVVGLLIQDYIQLP